MMTMAKIIGHVIGVALAIAFVLSVWGTDPVPLLAIAAGVIVDVFVWVYKSAEAAGQGKELDRFVAHNLARGVSRERIIIASAIRSLGGYLARELSEVLGAIIEERDPVEVEALIQRHKLGLDYSFLAQSVGGAAMMVDYKIVGPERIGEFVGHNLARGVPRQEIVIGAISLICPWISVERMKAIRSYVACGNPEALLDVDGVLGPGPTMEFGMITELEGHIAGMIDLLRSRVASLPGEVQGSRCEFPPAQEAEEAETPSVSLSCACGRKFRAPATRAGQRSKCPGCGREIRVPGIMAAAAPAPSGEKPTAVPSTRRTRSVALLGIAGAAILLTLGLIAWPLLRGGSDSSETGNAQRVRDPWDMHWEHVRVYETHTIVDGVHHRGTQTAPEGYLFFRAMDGLDYRGIPMGEGLPGTTLCLQAYDSVGSIGYYLPLEIWAVHDGARLLEFRGTWLLPDGIALFDHPRLRPRLLIESESGGPWTAVNLEREGEEGVGYLDGLEESRLDASKLRHLDRTPRELSGFDPDLEPVGPVFEDSAVDLHWTHYPRNDSRRWLHAWANEKSEDNMDARLESVRTLVPVAFLQSLDEKRTFLPIDQRSRPVSYRGAKLVGAQLDFERKDFERGERGSFSAVRLFVQLERDGPWRGLRFGKIGNRAVFWSEDPPVVKWFDPKQLEGLAPGQNAVEVSSVPPPGVRIEFMLEGVTDITIDSVCTALGAIQGVADVRTGARGVVQVTVKPGMSVDLESISRVVEGAKLGGGPDLRVDTQGLMLAGTVEIQVGGVATLDESTSVAKALSTIPWVSATPSDETPGKLRVRIAASKRVRARELIKAISKASPGAAASEPPRFRLENITWMGPNKEGR